MDTCSNQCNDPDGNSSPPRSCLDASVGVSTSSDEEHSDDASEDFAALSNISGLPQNDESGVETPVGTSPKEEQAVDAICRRTRANFPLTDMSLDELETFLQESDEEDYFQNVDDEEEYRKFVAAVQGNLREGAGIDSTIGNKQGEEDDEDEDEEDDYDFEVELEEALDSDYDELPKQEVSKRKRRRQAAILGRTLKKRALAERPLGSARTPLRPLLPSIAGRDTPNEARKLFNEVLQSGKEAVGFTPCQRRQLQCLIQEHVQLLIQVFAVTVPDPARQQIAVDTQKLLLQLADARTQVLSWNKLFHPEVCCCPQNAHSTTMSNFQPLVKLSALQPRSPSQLVAKQLARKEPESLHTGSSDGKADLKAFPSSNLHRTESVEDADKHAHVEAFEESSHRAFDLAPRKIYSVLDISALALVKDFVADVMKGVQNLKQQRLHASESIDRPQKPLFPVSMVQVSPAQNCQRKKTMAGSLVEDTKMNGIILVPAEISAAVSRFTAIFDPNLFPFKPPPAALAKRLLFTEAEDELLAMGLMRYNTNWEKIQQLLLPSKTTHQIFVRQKNRSTARAPENSIKAVRRLKTSPLTKEEEACIEEGLKFFRSDWMKVWEHCVPYRDPATLSRLWRAAVGLQKSYNTSEEAKEKHRIGEKMRRQKQALLKEQNDGNMGDLNSGDETCEETPGAYLHEAFLMDYNSLACSSPGPPNSIAPCHGNSTIQNLHTEVINPLMSTGPCLPALRSNPISDLPASQTHASTSRMSRRAAKRYRRSSFQTIKLAPGLPLLNLPRCVRVISQAKYNSQFSGHCASSLTGLPRASSCSKKGGFVASTSVTMPTPVLGTASSTGILDSSNFYCGQKSTAAAKMHPLLMQNTFDSGSPLPDTSSKQPSCTVISGVPSTQNIPRFRPFLPSSRVISIINCKEAPVAPTETSGRSSAELHPFLQDDGESQIQSDVLTKSKAVDILHTSTSTSLSGNTNWPFLLSDAVIRPEPRRVVRFQDGNPDCSASVQKRNPKGHTASFNTEGGKHARKGHRKDKTGSGHVLQPSVQEKVVNISFIKPGIEDNIVMEQEELSGSEEETEEVVQFEYEEITDSDVDESDCGKNAFHLDKEEEGIEFEEEEIESDDSASEVGI